MSIPMRGSRAGWLPPVKRAGVPAATVAPSPVPTAYGAAQPPSQRAATVAPSPVPTAYGAAQPPSQRRAEAIPPVGVVPAVAWRSGRRLRNTEQLNLRLPAKLLALVRSFAEKRGLPLNTVGTSALAHFVGSG
jgi:hypothetical protein